MINLILINLYIIAQINQCTHTDISQRTIKDLKKFGSLLLFLKTAHNKRVLMLKVNTQLCGSVVFCLPVHPPLIPVQQSAL